jgi:hypothetical protein
MMARTAKYNRNEIIADWETGKYTERSLAHKHKISSGTIHNIVTGVTKSLEPLISKQVEINQEIAKLNEQELSNFKQEVDERTRDLTYFNKTQIRLANIAVEMVEEKKQTGELSMMELSSASRVVKDSREGVVGKAPDTAIQINNNGSTSSVSTMTRADRERRLAELMGN